MRVNTPLTRPLLLKLLAEMGQMLATGSVVELTVVGGSAGILTGELPANRTTIDCDVIRAEPAEQLELVRQAAVELGRKQGLPDGWFNNQIAQLDVLPSGWRKRRVEIGTFGRLKIWCIGRLDLLALKIYAGRMQDRTDVSDMQPNAAELAFVRRYLQQLRVPSRHANLDQIQSALRFLDAMEESQP